MSETRILIRLLRMYSAQLCQNFGISEGGGFEPPSRYATGPRVSYSRYRAERRTVYVRLTWFLIAVWSKSGVLTRASMLNDFVHNVRLYWYGGVYSLQNTFSICFGACLP
jgi:hypothetical protein